MTKWCIKMRKDDFDDLLSMTVDTAIKTKTIKKINLILVTVDTTV